MMALKLRWLFLVVPALLLAGAVGANENIRPIGKVNLAQAKTETAMPQGDAAKPPPPAEAKQVAPPAPAVQAPPQKPSPQPAAAKTASKNGAAPSSVNRFNRLLQPPSKRNPPLAGIRLLDAVVRRLRSRAF